MLPIPAARQLQAGERRASYWGFPPRTDDFRRCSPPVARAPGYQWPADVGRGDVDPRLRRTRDPREDWSPPRQMADRCVEQFSPGKPASDGTSATRGSLPRTGAGAATIGHNVRIDNELQASLLKDGPGPPCCCGGHRLGSRLRPLDSIGILVRLFWSGPWPTRATHVLGQAVIASGRAGSGAMGGCQLGNRWRRHCNQRCDRHLHPGRLGVLLGVASA
jgi:hypothetical protein